MAQPQNESNAFTFDDDEDMDFLMEKAAQAGSAAVDEQHEGADVGKNLFGDEDEDLASTAPVALEPPEPVLAPEPEPVFVPEAVVEADDEVESDLDNFDLDEEFNFDSELENSTESLNVTVSSVEEEMAALQAETAAAVAEEPAEAPVRVPPKADPRVDAIRELEKESSHPTPVESPKADSRQTTTAAHSSPRIIRQTEEEQIGHATAILAAADEYRKLNAQERAVVAQLITQDAEFADDAASIAIRAINAEELTFATMEALKKAKGEEPVDRAFYILGLDDAVRNSLGQLCTAFSGEELQGGNTLAFSRELVREIEKLDSEAIHFVSATEAVLRAAKQR